MEDRRPNFSNTQRQSGGNRRGLRDARRAYEHRNTREELRDWSFQPPPFDPTRAQSNRKPTTRSAGFKQKLETDKYEKNNPSTLRPSVKETPPQDEPMYDMGPHSTLIPMQDVHVQNFDFCGFIPLIEETYEKMRGVDPRLGERLPLSLFTHVCCNHLNLQIAEVARQNGQNIFGVRADLRESLPDYQCIPKSITDYISHASNALTQTGVELKLNLPQIAIPLPPDDDVPSGSFGPLNAQTHNVYEAYPNPLVTANRVLASQGNNAEYQPLPNALVPPNLIPNRNLLGYGPIDAQNPGMQQRLQGINFLNDDSIEGRYKISHTACNRVYTVLCELKDRFKMSEYRRVENKEGLNHMEKILSKTSSANLTFVESEGPVNPLVMPLFERSVNIYSNSAQGSATANQSGLEVLHRRRMARGPNAAIGPCYCTQAGATPGGWAVTANMNFEMQGAFAPVIHFDYPIIRMEMFSSRGPAGLRRNNISSFLERNYYVAKK